MQDHGHARAYISLVLNKVLHNVHTPCSARKRQCSRGSVTVNLPASSANMMQTRVVFDSISAIDVQFAFLHDMADHDKIAGQRCSEECFLKHALGVADKAKLQDTLSKEQPE